MRREPRGNRQPDAAPQRRTVASDAAALWARGAGHMLSMIELHVKALFEVVGKSFQRRVVAVRVRVTDRAYRDVWCRELREMAAGAVLVSREAGLRRIIIPVMAG